MKKIKLFIINQHSITGKMPGGTRHYDISKKLLKYKVETTIFSSSFSHCSQTQVSVNSRFKITHDSGIRFVWIKNRSYKNVITRVFTFLTFYFQVIVAAKKIDDKPDVVVGSSPSIFAALAGLKIAKHYKVPFIMEIRDLWPEALILINGKKNYLFYLLLKTIEQKLYRNSKAIIFLMPMAKDYLIANGVPKKNIHWISNGVDLSYFPKNKKSVRTKKFKATFAGSLNKSNDVTTIIRAAKYTSEKNIQFQIIGTGRMKEKLESLAGKLDLKNVKFIGSIEKEKVAQYLCQSDLLIFPLIDSQIFKYGICANKLFDYLASGRPIISAAKVPNDYIRESGCGSSIAPENPELMAEEVLRFYKMTEGQRNRIGNRGRVFVVKHFKIEDLARRFAEVLFSVV